MHDAFISYSTADSAEAYSVRNFLRRSGCTCWMAPDDIPAGSDYADAIPKAIADCRVFVLILSVDAQNSIWVRKELDKALDKGKTVIPFMLYDFKLSDSFDFLLGNAQWCYAYRDRNAALQKILTAVKGSQGTYSFVPKKPKQPVSQPQPKPSAPKAPPAPKPAAPTPKPTAAPAKKRSADPKVSSKWLYRMVTWGLFWSITGVLIGVSMYLSMHTAIGDAAVVIAALGLPATIILTIALHKSDRINRMIRRVKRGNFIGKCLLWLFVGVGIFVALGAIAGLTYLQITGQDSLTQDQTAILAAVSGVLSLLITPGWLKKYAF